jgi:hypothetical protein
MTLLDLAALAFALSVLTGAMIVEASAAMIAATI